MQTVEHLVVGGGAMGLATAWQLAKNEREVTVLEQFELDHKSGLTEIPFTQILHFQVSSYGENLKVKPVRYCLNKLAK
jgi:glycine/D-amino acid oxidase-like deaminating enzyme